MITTGNHVYRQRDAYEFIDSCERLVRPANYPKGNPGKGSAIVEVGGVKVGVLNLSGELQLTVARSPFPAADAELAELRRTGAEVVIVDFHAEVTSEKVAMGWHLDGRVAAVLGTHTHVPTADARVLPGGTAFISDVGMTGARNEHPRGRGRGRPRPLPDPDADPLPDRRGRRLDQRRRSSRSATTAWRRRSSRSCARPASPINPYRPVAPMGRLMSGDSQLADRQGCRPSADAGDGPAPQADPALHVRRPRRGVL